MSASKFTVADRKRLATLLGISEQYLYQCLRGLRDMNPVEARRCEVESHGELMRWDLCQKNWRGIWPELVGGEGSPLQPNERSTPAHAPGEERRHEPDRRAEARLAAEPVSAEALAAAIAANAPAIASALAPAVSNAIAPAIVADAPALAAALTPALAPKKKSEN